MLFRLVPLLFLVSACLAPKGEPPKAAAPKLDRARIVVISERLDVASALARELSQRGYAARPVAPKELEQAELGPRVDALRSVIAALPAGRTSGAGLGSAPLALAEGLGAHLIVHARRLARSRMEVAIVDGRTGALVWRVARDAADDPGAAVAAIAPALRYPPTSRRASTNVATTANET